MALPCGLENSEYILRILKINSTHRHRISRQVYSLLIKKGKLQFFLV